MVFDETEATKLLIKSRKLYLSRALFLPGLKVLAFFQSSCNFPVVELCKKRIQVGLQVKSSQFKLHQDFLDNKEDPLKYFVIDMSSVIIHDPNDGSSLHKKLCFPLKISSVNVTKSARN